MKKLHRALTDFLLSCGGPKISTGNLPDDLLVILRLAQPPVAWEHEPLVSVGVLYFYVRQMPGGSKTCRLIISMYKYALHSVHVLYVELLDN